MKRKTPHRPLADIDRKLSKAAKLLDAAAADIRDADLKPGENIPKIGSALATIFEIQHQIYRHEPALAPAFLKKARAIAETRERKARKKGSKQSLQVRHRATKRSQI